MKKLAAFLALGIGIFTVARADETPHLEFVKQLRAKQYGDLALQYLKVLEKEAPPEVAAFIPIERASIHLDRAQQATNPADRARYYELARAGFDAFIKSSKDKSPALAAIAQLESSRILGLQGRNRLARTRSLNGGALTAEMTRILGMFEDANVQLEAAGAAIDKQLRAKHPEKMAAALEQARLQADLELALNQLDQGLTYDALNKGVIERGKKIDTAQKFFHDLHGRDPKGALGLLASAWEIKCYLEVDQINEAYKTYKAVMNNSGPKGETAQRMAQSFYIQMLTAGRNVNALKLALKVKTDDEIQKEVQRAAREWLKQYPSHVNSYEGNTIRFELANSIRSQGDAFKKIGKDQDQLDPKAKPFIQEALQMYDVLAELDTEYSPEVNSYRYKCMYELSDATADVKPGDAAKIQSFEFAVNAAKQAGFKIGKEGDEIWRLKAKKNRTPQEDAKLAKMEKERPERIKQLMKGAEEALLRALELLQQGKAAKVKAKDILEAHANLAWVLMNNGDLHRSVVVGEHAAHMPAAAAGEAKQAAQAAAWALQSYAQLISKGTKEGYPKEMIDSDRRRFRGLVDFMEATWKDDPSTDAARHQLGSQLLADKDFKGAEDVLSRVSDRYNPDGLIDARRRWCIACIELGKEPKLTEAEKKKYHQNSVKALRSVPELTSSSGPDTAAAYVGCKIMLGGILFQSKEYTELERVALALKAQVPTLKVDEANKEYLMRQAENLLSYAKYGQANVELQNGNYAKALSMAEQALKPVDEAVRKVRVRQKKIQKQYDALVEEADTAKTLGKTLDKAKQETMEELRQQLDELSQSVARDAELQRGLRVVAIRAAVQDGNRARARGLLDQLLEESKNDKAGLQALAQMVAQLKKQINELKEKTDAKSKTQLAALLTNFLGFLDAMAKQPKLDPTMIFFLADSYSGVGEFKSRNLHADAAKLLEQIKEPKPVPGVPIDKKAEATYHYAQLKLVQELRMARKFDEARKVRAYIENQSWGKGFSVMKEKPLILMEEGKYGGAAVAWNRIIQSFGGSPNFNNAQIKENYFESYYQYIYCLFLYAKTATDPKIKAKAPDYIKRAGNAIYKLEVTPPGDMGGESFKKRYQELLNKEPLLKQAYEAIKKEKAAGPKAEAAK